MRRFACLLPAALALAAGCNAERAVPSPARPAAAAPATDRPETDRPETDGPGRAARDTSRYTLLGPSQALPAVRQCSRGGPQAEAGWALTEEDAAALERHLPALLAMPPATFPRGARVERLDRTHRQYVGVVVGGRRLIYVNAFPASLTATPGFRPGEVSIVCDGGAAFWGAVYDPATGRFSDLLFNGPG